MIASLALVATAGLLLGWAIGGRVRNLLGHRARAIWLPWLAAALQFLHYESGAVRQAFEGLTGLSMLVPIYGLAAGWLLVNLASRARLVQLSLVIVLLGAALNMVVITLNGAMLPWLGDVIPFSIARMPSVSGTWSSWSGWRSCSPPRCALHRGRRQPCARRRAAQPWRRSEEAPLEKVGMAAVQGHNGKGQGMERLRLQAFRMAIVLGGASTLLYTLGAGKIWFG
jgi:hypothetical protein